MQITSIRLKLMLLLVCAGLPGLIAARYTIEWYTVDGGGGWCSGDPYQLSCTIGQPEAGNSPMIGDSYTLVGGFWVAAIQVAGAPRLGIQATSNNQVRIWWEPDASGWTLQKSPSLVSNNWVNAASGSTNPATVPVVAPKTYYRLFKQ